MTHHQLTAPPACPWCAATTRISWHRTRQVPVTVHCADRCGYAQHLPTVPDGDTATVVPDEGGADA